MKKEGNARFFDMPRYSQLSDAVDTAVIMRSQIEDELCMKRRLLFKLSRLAAGND